MNWCCQTWLDLGTELAELKTSSLEKLLKKGIPRSTFSPIYRLLENLGKFCPMCGSKVSSVGEVFKEQERPAVIPIVETKSASTIKCPPCRGTGKVGDGLNCMTCLGAGVLDRGNPMRAKFDPIFAKENAEKLERNNARIVAVEREIEKNPKPLREDAKPESWAR